MTRTAQFMTQDEIKKRFNTTHLVIQENIIQVQDFQTKEYHYLVENCYGWNDSGITSLNGDFFNQIIEENKS